MTLRQPLTQRLPATVQELLAVYCVGVTIYDVLPSQEDNQPTTRSAAMTDKITVTIDGFHCAIDIDTKKAGLAPNSNRCTIHLTGPNPLQGSISTIIVYCTVFLEKGGQTVTQTSWSSTEMQYDVNAAQLNLKREADVHLMGAAVKKVEATVAADLRARSDGFDAVFNVT